MRLFGFTIVRTKKYDNLLDVMVKEVLKSKDYAKRLHTALAHVEDLKKSISRTSQKRDNKGRFSK